MVLIFAETWEGTFKKSTFEAVQYGAACAQAQGTEAYAVVVGPCTPPVESLGAHGAAKVIHLHGTDRFEPAAFAIGHRLAREGIGRNPDSSQWHGQWQVLGRCPRR